MDPSRSFVPLPGNHVRVAREDGQLCMAQVVNVDEEGFIICKVGDAQLKIDAGAVQPGWQVVGSSVDSHLDIAKELSSSTTQDAYQTSFGSNNMGLPQPQPGCFAEDLQGRIVLLTARAADGSWTGLECCRIGSVLPPGAGDWAAPTHFVITDKQLQPTGELYIVSIQPRMLYRREMDLGYYEFWTRWLPPDKSPVLYRFSFEELSRVLEFQRTLYPSFLVAAELAQHKRHFLQALHRHFASHKAQLEVKRLNKPLSCDFSMALACLPGTLLQRAQCVQGGRSEAVVFNIQDVGDMECLWGEGWTSVSCARPRDPAELQAVSDRVVVQGGVCLKWCQQAPDVLQIYFTHVHKQKSNGVVLMEMDTERAAVEAARARHQQHLEAGWERLQAAQVAVAGDVQRVTGTSSVGLPVLGMFSGKWYDGLVTGSSSGSSSQVVLYDIKWSDGDTEQVDLCELVSLSCERAGTDLQEGGSSMPCWWTDDTRSKLDKLGSQLKRLLKTTDLQVTAYVSDVWRANGVGAPDAQELFPVQPCGGEVLNIYHQTSKVGSAGWMVEVQVDGGVELVCVPLARTLLHGWQWNLFAGEGFMSTAVLDPLVEVAAAVVADLTAATPEQAADGPAPEPAPAPMEVDEEPPDEPPDNLAEALFRHSSTWAATLGKARLSLSDNVVLCCKVPGTDGATVAAVARPAYGLALASLPAEASFYLQAVNPVLSDALANQALRSKLRHVTGHRVRPAQLQALIPGSLIEQWPLLGVELASADGTPAARLTAQFSTQAGRALRKVRRSSRRV